MFAENFRAIDAWALQERLPAVVTLRPHLVSHLRRARHTTLVIAHLPAVDDTADDAQRRRREITRAVKSAARATMGQFMSHRYVLVEPSFAMPPIMGLAGACFIFSLSVYD